AARRGTFRRPPSRSYLRKPPSKARPEGHLSSFLRKTFRTHQPGRLSFGAPSDSDTCPRKTIPIFEAFSKPCRMPPFEDSAEAPAGPPFGDCHLSRKSARSHFSESPFRHTFEPNPSVLPSERATCPEG